MKAIILATLELLLAFLIRLESKQRGSPKQRHVEAFERIAKDATEAARAIRKGEEATNARLRFQARLRERFPGSF